MPHHHLLAKSKRLNRKSIPDRLVYIAAFLAPLFELPQLITVYSQHSAKDVSVLTWGFFALASGTWLVYAIRHRITPLLISYALFFTVETVTFVGILIYR